MTLSPVTLIIVFLLFGGRIMETNGASALLTGNTWSTIARALKLSARELQIVICMIDRQLETDDQIAAALGISPHTVHTHLERLFRKLGVTSRTHLILRVFSAYVHAHDAARQTAS